MIEPLLRTVDALALPEASAWLLERLSLLDVDPEAARAVAERDVHGRSGVVGWTLLERLAADEGLQGLSEATLACAGWGLVQIVGLQPTDPIVPGDAAVRLTGLGRVCVGLAPGAEARLPSGDPIPWDVLHGASREALVLEATGDDPDARIPAMGVPADVLAARIAVRLRSGDAVVLDATRVDDPVAWEVVADVLLRTRLARGPRTLLVLDPTPIRAELASIGAVLTWCEPRGGTRRERWVLDERVTDALRATSEEARPSDLLGVPFHGIAPPLAPRVRLSDVVVGRETARQLAQAMAHARYRTGRAGVDVPARNRGYKLLLTGPPGTGKTTVGEALAAELRTSFMRLDLSVVLSRWLGETERMLAEVFDLAESVDAVLVLDEADSLMRQREGRGGGGEALATSIAFLLTRMERYTGALVATSNRLQDLDEAFFRRFDDYVVLPIPEAPVRREIWARSLPEGADVDVDALSRLTAISGGLIRGAALRAIAWSAADGAPLDTVLVLASLVRELEKNDRSPREVLVEPYREGVERLLGG